jgi:nucleotide-binding universal stress UspA family protein
MQGRTNSGNHFKCPKRRSIVKAQFHLPLATYPDVSSFAIIQNAVELARHQQAELTVSLQQSEMPGIAQPLSTSIEATDISAEAEEFSHDPATALIAAARNYASKAEVPLTEACFTQKEPFVGDKIAALSRIYDLSIMEASPMARPLIESVLFASGRPLVLFPTDNFCGRIDTVAIGWDGSATLARALTGARLFLEKASRAIVISVTDDKDIDENMRERFAAVLRRTVRTVDVVVANAHGEPAGGAIQAICAENRADLLVVGGFGHSRLREVVLGGVTRTLLDNLEIPVLLAH